MQIALNTLLTQADSLRFKLLAIIGKNEEKKTKIIGSLKKDNWTLIDVETELLELQNKLDQEEPELEFEISTRVKEWFHSKPNKLILTRASILYHDLFLKISPLGAFKYNTRNKNCVIFLEDEQKLGRRIYYGQVGRTDYYDQEINDIVLVNIDEITELFDINPNERFIISDVSQLQPDAIGRLFDFKQIKDVIDIDADLKESNRKKELVSSFIVSESLEQQILDFFEDLDKPTHKARTVIGNYGSGKSHLVGFLVSLVEDPQLAANINNEKIQKSVGKFSRKYLSVQFELQSGQVELKRWFYGKIRQQLKTKYDVEIPIFDAQQDYDDKENIVKIVEIVKSKFPDTGLLVVIDEISDFLTSRQKEAMKADLQFLRVVGQVCQDQDIMFIGSMQEDVFSSPKFKDVASELGRIGERFQNIIIHREDIKRVISQRIVPKNPAQRHKLETLFSPFADKIEAVSRNLDDYVDLFPLTPFLIEMFSDLPYFEKRGVIQFAISEIRYLLDEAFPSFITFEKIYDQLEINPNKRNLEEIFELTKAMNILLQKINLVEYKYQADARKIVKGLAVYSLWNKQQRGVLAEELANHLMLLPQNKLLSAPDSVSLIIKKIREATDGEYIKIQKDQITGQEYFLFETKTGVDPEQKIAQKTAAISQDELEYELFFQLREILELDNISGQTDVFDDECDWRSAKSFRQGYIIFVKKYSKFSALEPRDYAICFISPFAEKFDKRFAQHQIHIKLDLKGIENIELLKEIVAIKALLNNNFQKDVMAKKLEQRINGYQEKNTTFIGFKFRLSKLLLHSSECDLNGQPQSITKILARMHASVPEIIDELKSSLLDQPFHEQYPLHPTYSMQLSSRNIIQSLNSVVNDLTRGDFGDLGRASTWFLQNLNLLDSQNYPDLSQSKIAQKILDILKAKNQHVTDIEKDLVLPLKKSDYGLEAEIVYFFLVISTLLGKTFLQLRGGERIDINNLKEKIKTLAAFETIAYVRLQEDFSYDFASRLLNALGLNGAKITLEKERLNAFKEYKERIRAILQNLSHLEESIQRLKQKQQLFIDLSAVEAEFTEIKAIDWNALDLANHTQFGTLNSFSDKLEKIVIALNKTKNLTEALEEYHRSIHEAIVYMNQAIELLQNHPLLVTDIAKQNALQEFRDDVLAICREFNKFSDRSQRNPVKGKIQQFRKIFIYDFYLPAHEKYVGKKVPWTVLEHYPQLESFKKVSVLSQLTCINDTVLRQKILSWNDLKQFHCQNKNLEDTLQNSVFCQQCLFPRKANYQVIPNTLDQVEEEIENLLETYEKTVVKEIRAYRDNVQYLESAAEKQLIETILEQQKLPEMMTPQMVKTINKLFKEIEIIEIEREQIIETLFPNDSMTTIEELRRHFLALEEQLKKNRLESEIRIKLK